LNHITRPHSEATFQIVTEPKYRSC